MTDLTAVPTYKDRTVGLIVVGILEICLALLCLLNLGVMAIAVFAVKAQTAMPQTTNARTMMGAGLFYLILAAFFGTMGIGTMRARRWARTLMLVVSWMWLVVGAFSSILMVFILPKMLGSIERAAGPAGGPGITTFMTGCMFVILGLVYIALPAILVLFYRGPNVKATVEAKDPSVPWTDRTPAPVLALSLLLGYGAVASLIGISYGAFPLFGRIISGIPAVLGFIFMAVLSAILAVAVYRRRPAAWWTLAGLWVLGCVSTAFFFVGGGLDMRELYEAMGMANPELERMGIYDIWKNPAVLILMAVGMLAWFGYLLWVRKFFRPAEDLSAPFA
ncbi:MAG TPA: hypothetical protein VGX68_25785 [Thermoanaerobaculia bacterium]|jgi:hypothetical protein|nr:hypothetical protein [Thermoanaerobaculia bacterium]